MMGIDPTPYLAAYVVVVFVAPRAIFMTALIRELSFASSKGILGIRRGWRQDLDRFRRHDPQARCLYALVHKWMRITAVMWILGFVALGAGLFLLDRAGVLIGSKGAAGG